MTSPQAAIVLLEELVPAGSTILVVGGEGLTSVVEAHGFRVTRSAEDGPAAVIQGFHPSVAWTDLAEAAYALKVPADGGPGIPWVATNTDWTIPQARGTAPGNGTLVSAVHTAIGRLPIVAGKPERAIFDAAVERFAHPARLFWATGSTPTSWAPIARASPSALVLTGIDGPKQVLAADADSRPAFLLGDLRELFEPYPAPVEERDERTGDRIFRSAAAVVRLAGNAVTIDAAGDRPIDLLRAGTAAVWGAGVPIYALDVAPGLYS